MAEIATEPDAGTAARCEHLLAARGARVRRLADRLLGQDAADGVQEVFWAACRSLPGYRGQARLTTWFHRLAVRVLCAYRRRRDRLAGREAAEAEPEARLPLATLRSYQASPFDAAVASERRRRVLAALERLSPPLREVLVLRLEDLSYAELAAALGIPVGTVKSRMAAAMVQLAVRLQDGDAQGEETQDAARQQAETQDEETP